MFGLFKWESTRANPIMFFGFAFAFHGVIESRFAAQSFGVGDQQLYMTGVAINCSCSSSFYFVS